MPRRSFSAAKLWELFDGDRERLNIAHECIDRHVDGPNPPSSSSTPTEATRSWAFASSPKSLPASPTTSPPKA